MADTNPRSGDVDSALDLFIGDRPGQPVTPTQPAANVVKPLPTAKPPSEQRRSERTAASATVAARSRRPKARTGRPPGLKPNESRLKDKTSLAVDLELMDFYRQQSWAEQCQLGELVERALRDYAAKTWKWKRAKTSIPD